MRERLCTCIPPAIDAEPISHRGRWRRIDRTGHALTAHGHLTAIGRVESRLDRIRLNATIASKTLAPAKPSPAGSGTPDGAAEPQAPTFVWPARVLAAP